MGIAGPSRDTFGLLSTLIEAGLDVNAISYGSYANGYRPLHVTALHNYPEMVRRLLKAGADPTLANDHDETPLTYLLQYFENQSKRFNKRQRVTVEENLQRYAEVLKLLKTPP